MPVEKGLLTLAPIDEQAARVALFVLHGAMPEDASRHEYIIDRSARRISSSEVIRHLAQLAKPVDCSATVANGLLTINCYSMEGKARENYPLRGASGAAHLESSLRRAGCAEPIDDAMVLLRHKQHELTVPFRVIRRWRVDYYTKHMLSSIGARNPPPPGVCIAFDVEPPVMTVDIIHGES